MKLEVQKVLKLFTSPSNALRKIVNAMLNMPDKILIEALIQKNRMPLTDEDRELLRLTETESRNYIKRGQHHLFSYILGESGKFHAGVQETYPRDADCESCAEVGAISSLDIARDKPKTVCTVHFMPIAERGGSGVTTIVPPCLRCSGRFRHLYKRHNDHNFGIIVYWNEEVIKVSVTVAHLLQYPEGYFYGHSDDHHKA
jgi:cytidine deaminase